MEDEVHASFPARHRRRRHHQGAVSTDLSARTRAWPRRCPRSHDPLELQAARRSRRTPEGDNAIPPCDPFLLRTPAKSTMRSRSVQDGNRQRRHCGNCACPTGGHIAIRDERKVRIDGATRFVQERRSSSILVPPEAWGTRLTPTGPARRCAHGRTVSHAIPSPCAQVPR